MLDDEKENHKKSEEAWVKYVDLSSKLLKAFKSENEEEKKAAVQGLKDDLDTFRIEASNAMAQELDAGFSRSVDLGKHLPNTAKVRMRISGFVALISFFLSILIGWVYATLLGRLMMRIAQDVLAKAESTDSVSNTIADSSQKLADESQVGASALQQAASALQEIVAMLDRSVADVQTTQTSAEASKKAAESGLLAVQNLSESVKRVQDGNVRIKTQFEASNKKIAEIINVISAIGDKTKVINDIVFQTKLLSFNASVEAARAGENGKGFSVVAEEVGNLAQMSGAAAKENSEMLQNGIESVNRTITEAQASIQVLLQANDGNVTSGAQLSESCAGMLEEIVEQVSTVNELVQRITQAFNEQSQGTTEINQAVTRLDASTQTNAVSIRKTAEAGAELKTLTMDLKQASLVLLATIEGQRNAAGESELSQPAASVSTDSEHGRAAA